MHSNPDDEIGGYYVSTHAANIFLSEVRNTCFDADALDTLNTFLDDLLYAILQASGDAPLVTDHIRQGLLKTLSNPLGQAALLEAEIELRAYRDASRTTKPKKVEGEELPATWAFKLVRLKCQALSTMSDTSEESQNAREARVKEEIQEAGLTGPSAGLLIPAALYLTAILEFISEYVLANVSRVVIRDSSRTNATMFDLFTALCEDHATYEIFKTLGVYKILEEMFPKSPTRRDKQIFKDRIGRADSPRVSTDSNVTAASLVPTMSHAHSRSSYEKRFKVGNGRKSLEEKRSQGKRESYLSEEGRKSFASHNDADGYQDSTLQKEFDELMRSDATMKVSLTPERLKNELGRKDKHDNQPEPQSPTPLTQHKRSITIIEDEDTTKGNKTLPKSRRRLNSLSTSRKSASSTRNRKRSATFTAESSNGNRSTRQHDLMTGRATSYEAPVSPEASHTLSETQKRLETPFPSTIPNSGSMQRVQALEKTSNEVKPVQHELQSQATSKPLRPAVSAATRELIAFLDEGPPVTSSNALLEDGVFHDTLRPSSPSKGVNKLQRMLNKLALGNSRRNKQGLASLISAEEARFRADSSVDYTNHTHPPNESVSTTTATNTNRVLVPPPSIPHHHVDTNSAVSTKRALSLGRKSSVARKPVPMVEDPDKTFHDDTTPSYNQFPARRSSLIAYHSQNGRIAVPSSPIRPSGSTSTNHGFIFPSPSTGPGPYITASAARDIQRLLATATSVDECRVIFDAFMAGSGMALVDSGSASDPVAPTEQEYGQDQ